MERVSGITEIRLFPDFEGFASLRDDQTPYMPLSAAEYIKRADQAVRRNKFDVAIADYDMAIYRNPNDAFIYYSRGLAKTELAKVEPEKYDAAIADYDEAIQLNPDDSFAYYQRGRAKAELRQYDAAIADYDEAIRLDPNNTLIYNQREVVKAQQEQYETET